MNTQQIKNQFLNPKMVELLIYVNILVFFIVLALESFQIYIPYQLFSLPSDFDVFLTKPWSIISYGFLHQRFVHLLGNIIMLFYFGNLFVDFFKKKQLLIFYIFGTIFGGILFVFGGFLLPNVIANESVLLGASAGVTAILIGIATYLPNYQVRFSLIGYVKLWHIAVFWMVYNLLLITADYNIGGNIAHFGGALFGFLYVQQLRNKETSKSNTTTSKSPLKTVHKSDRPKRKQHQKPRNQQKIDDILDKIGKSGYDSLSQEEKDFLFQQGKK